MQVVEFESPMVNILFVVVFWTILQITIPVICMKVADKHFCPGSLLFRTRKWEKMGKYMRSSLK